MSVKMSRSLRWRVWAWKNMNLRIGFWLFAVHPIWFWLPTIDRHEPTIDEPTVSGWSFVWLCIEVAYVQH
jgi:hypothetical protein